MQFHGEVGVDVVTEAGVMWTALQVLVIMSGTMVRGTLRYSQVRR